MSESQPDSDDGRAREGRADASLGPPPARAARGARTRRLAAVAGVDGATPRSDGAEQVLELVAPPPPALPVAGAWRRLFDGASTQELLDRLSDGDPLGIWPRCAAELERRRFVVHPDRLWIAALARTALLAPTYRGRPAIEAWLEERVAESLHGLLTEDASAEIERRPVDPEDFWQHAMMVEVFGVEPPLARRAAVVFNAQRPARRRVLFALAFEGRALADVVASGLASEHEAKEHLTAGLAALARLAPPTFKDLLALEGEG